jgi:hypothetical protein
MVAGRRRRERLSGDGRRRVPTSHLTPPSNPPPLHQIQARGDQGRLTGDYIRSMRLLQNTSRAVGDLIMVYKRVSNLAGHTARVAELLEQVRVYSVCLHPTSHCPT